jgi:MFS family permease
MAAMQRMVILVSAIVLLDLATFSAIIPLLPRFTDELGLSKTEAGILVGAYSFAVVALAVPIGHVSDRVGPRTVTIAGTLLMAAATAALALAGSFWVLAASRFAQGAASCAAWSAGLAWLAARAPADRRGATIAWANAAAMTGMVAGPLVGGVLTGRFGVGPTFGAVTGISLVLAAWCLLERPAAIEDDREHRVLRGMKVSVEDRLISLSLLTIALVSVVSSSLQVLLSLELHDLGASRDLIGALFAGAALLGAVAIVASGRGGDRIGRVRLAAMAGGALAIVTLGLVLPLPLAGVAAALLVIGPVQSVLYGVGYPLGADGADRAGVGQGLVLGVINLAWGVGAVIGPVAGASLADRLGNGASYAALAATCVVYATYMMRSDLALRTSAATAPAAGR